MKQRTAKDRFQRTVKRVGQWCKNHRHWSVAEQHAALMRQLRGHANYYGITGNRAAVHRFRFAVTTAWQKWLNRRSARNHMTWARFYQLLQRYPIRVPPTQRASP